MRHAETVSGTEPATYPTSVDELHASPTVPIWSATEPNMCGALGIGRTLGHVIVRRGEVPSIRLGRRVRISSAHLLAMLGADGPEDV